MWKRKRDEQHDRGWQTVYHYFRPWRRDGTWSLIHDLLRGDVREAEA